MSNLDGPRARTLLQQIARRAMVARGLDPDFSPAALLELAAIQGPAPTPGPATRDLRGLLWCSIDNDDSRDLDQLSVAEELPGGIFPMLPERLSTDLTSLSFQADRVALIIEMVFDRDGGMTGSDVYEALVNNRAKLAYNSVAAWLEGTGPIPAPLAAASPIPPSGMTICSTFPPSA